MIATLLLILLILSLVIFSVPRIITELISRNKIFSITEAPQEKVAVIFGAGLLHNGTPSPVLRDRVETGVSLYQEGKVEKLLMSGDNRFEDYNEPGAMLEYAVKLGIPEEDILLDFAGRSTYDTCFRARFIFGIEDALLVTQRYHLPRAITICEQLGISAEGVAAENKDYRKSSLLYWNLRELPATTAAFWDLWIEKPLPVLGYLEPLFPEDSTNPTK